MAFELPCRTDPELFFPVADEGTEAFEREAAPARALCAGCPVRAACLDYALETGQDYGIWGGTSPAERRAPRVVAWLRRQLASV